MNDLKNLYFGLAFVLALAGAIPTLGLAFIPVATGMVVLGGIFFGAAVLSAWQAWRNWR